MKKDGSLIIDPIKGDNYNHFIDIYGDYVIGTIYGDLTDNTETYIVNCKSGEMKAYSDDSLRVFIFDSTRGKLFMKSNDYYYIAELEAPETLINPFEIADFQ